jgi:hypothetical protein
VEDKIVGVPSCYTDDASILNLQVDVGLPTSWAVYPVIDEERLCSRFDCVCGISMYWCAFDPIGLRFSLNSFEVDILNHKGPFSAHNRETGYKINLSRLNIFFGAPIGNDKLTL